jgi:hypothetical protein
MVGAIFYSWHGSYLNRKLAPTQIASVCYTGHMRKTFSQLPIIHRRLIIAGIILFVLGVAGCVYALVKQNSKSVAVITPVVTGDVSSPVLATPSPTATPAPVTTGDPLTGLAVSESDAAQPVMAVMIENLDPDARPQSGLSQAGIVYEALAEGGITRFMALFQEPFPTSIGPVRSLRPYYLEWGLEHNIPVVHAGGSQPALAEVGPSGLKNIDALGSLGSYFARTSDRVAPHNLYISGTSLANMDKALGYDQAPTFTPLARKSDNPSGSPTSPTITINFSTSGYAVKYVYDAASNSYARFLAGVPHVDRNTGKQIYVKNVVVQFTGTTYGTQEDGKPETDIQDVGSGQALVFVDGNLVHATWQKANAKAQTTFTDSNGQPIQFNPGNTWISVLPKGNSVTY